MESENGNQLSSIQHVNKKEPKKKKKKNTWNHMAPSKKMHFCHKNDLFYQTGSKSENGSQLGSILHVNIKEPTTPGTTLNHLKHSSLFQKWFISPSGLEIWKWEPARFHITCWHKGAKNTGNQMEPSKKKKADFAPKMIYFTKWVKNLKWGPARFFITLWLKGAENMGTTSNHLKKIQFSSKNDLFHQAGSKFVKMGTS